MSFLEKKTVLLTGGTGSFGKAFISKVLKDDEIEKLIVFSRDELKQFELAGSISSSKIEFCLGDVRDYQRLLRVSSGVDVIIHAAAMKQIPASELNPIEAIKTNVIGAENIVNAAIENGVSKVLALSTDKAANPANLYGATKLCSDKLMIAGNELSRDSKTRFAAVRYGNVLGSRGSVIPFFLEQAKLGSIPITDERMTRFWLTIEQAVDFVLSSVDVMHGGEIFVPRIPSFKVTDVANVVCPGIPTRIVGIRPGEKLHEIMITEDDAHYTFEFENYYVIASPGLIKLGVIQAKGKKVDDGFRFSSEINPLWHTSNSFERTLKESGII
jgi:UDP-N-acetylglucosamine 4,6-dehydratase